MRRTPFVVALLLAWALIGLARTGSAQDAARPTILNVTMDAAGDQLTIVGTGFGPAPVVTIDGQPVPVLPGATDTQVTVVTPAVLLTAPGTYRLTVVDSVRQVGEVFVVASRAGLVPAVSLTTSGTSAAPSGAGVATVQPRATGEAAAIPGAVSGAPPVGTFAIEDSGSPYRTALGSGALAANGVSGGTDNTAIGYQALLTNTAGCCNTASGSQALFSNHTGGSNTATGYHSLYANDSGIGNTASGYRALLSSTGYSNTALGYNAGGSATTGSYNLFLGAEVLGTAADTNTIRIGNTYNGGDTPPSGQNKTFIAGIRGTSVTGGFPVVIDANGQLGTADGGGNFGIGTTAPDSLLHAKGANYPVVNIESTSVNGGVLQLKSSINNWQAYNQTGSLRFSTSTAPAGDRVTFTSGGNVGIGTASPGTLLDVNKATTGRPRSPSGIRRPVL